jgi:hypothetical protein
MMAAVAFIALALAVVVQIVRFRQSLIRAARATISVRAADQRQTAPAAVEP